MRWRVQQTTTRLPAGGKLHPAATCHLPAANVRLLVALQPTITDAARQSPSQHQNKQNLTQAEAEVEKEPLLQGLCLQFPNIPRISLCLCNTFPHKTLFCLLPPAPASFWLRRALAYHRAWFDFLNALSISTPYSSSSTVLEYSEPPQSCSLLVQRTAFPATTTDTCSHGRPALVQRLAAMVYDRGRAVRDPHEGTQFASSGSPRSRFASDTANFVQNPGARPHAAPSSEGKPRS